MNKEALMYVLGWLLTLGFLVGGTRLDRADWHAPFSYDFDALLILPFVKETVEGGTHWQSPRLGAPHGQVLYDFPVVDHLHFGVIRLLSLFSSSCEVVFNLFYILTYPLTTTTALFAARRLGLSRGAALVVALLYAFQPYHYLRGQIHYFLSAYYIIPLTVVTLVELCRGQLPFFRQLLDGEQVRYRFTILQGATLWAVVVGVLTSAAGAYYAFFACAFFVAAGFYAWMQTRTYKAMLAAVAMVVVISVGGVANHWPTIQYQAEFGRNNRPHSRLAEEAEIYGMKVAQLVLPVPGHNPIGYGDRVFLDLASVRSAYQAPIFKPLNESDWDPIGIVASVGYIALLLLCLMPLKRGRFAGPLGALALFGTFLGTVGGIGALFNLLISPQVRCYNRVSIYLAFFALLFVGRCLDIFCIKYADRIYPLRWPFLFWIVIIGMWDQTNDQWFPDLRSPKPGYISVVDVREDAAKRYAEDREFFTKIETLIPDAMIFTYPFIEYPESSIYAEPGAAGSVQSYEPVVGYLHTLNLRFSFGAMKGREWDSWMRRVAGKEPVPTFLERIALVGYEGLLIDTRGMNPRRWQNLKVELDQYLGTGALREVHLGRKLYFFDLRNFRNTLVTSYGAAGFEARRTQEMESLVVLWLKGFISYEPVGYEERARVCGAGGQAVIVNPSQTTKTVTMSFKMRTIFKDRARITIDSDMKDEAGAPWREELEIDGALKPPTYERTVMVPPGRWKLGFRCEPLVPVLPADSRRELFTLLDFKVK